MISQDNFVALLEWNKTLQDGDQLFSYAQQAAREDFAFETTLAGRAYLRLVERLRADGWRVELIYLALPIVEMSKLRVAERVAHGGHNIPAADIEQRFPRRPSEG